MNSSTKVFKPGQVNFQAAAVCLQEVALPLGHTELTDGRLSGSLNSESSAAAQEHLDSAQREADRIVAEAQQAAEALIKQGRSSLEAERSSALQQAREQGYQAGYQNGMQAAQAEAQSILLDAQNLLKQAVHKHDELIREAENELIQLAMKIAAKILDKEIQEEPTFILRAVRKALRSTSQRDNLTLRVCPADVVHLSKARLLELGIPDVKIVEDANLRCGDCLLDGVKGRIDATLDSQMATVQQKLEVIAGG